MRERPILKLRPGLEQFEAKQLPSASPLTTPLVNLNARAGALSAQPAAAQGAVGAVGQQQSPTIALTLFRITNPMNNTAALVPPFDQVLVQSTMPKAGSVYNILFLSVRNGTARTFDASNGFAVKVTGQHLLFPVLTGGQQWKPGQVIVFYILTKKYFPLRPITSAGFQFDFGASSGIALPGPSGIFLRLKYNPATFARVLNHIVAFGPGAKGHDLGLPDTAVWEIISARTDLVPL
jgi:hypothetical protein